MAKADSLHHNYVTRPLLEVHLIYMTFESWFLPSSKNLSSEDANMTLTLYIKEEKRLKTGKNGQEEQHVMTEHRFRFSVA